MPPRRTDAELKAHIEASRVIDASSCWLWTGCKSNRGYGLIYWNGKLTQIHRTYWLLCGRTIPEGMEMCHGPLCVGKKHCFNPDHLTPDTRRKNALDMHRDGTMLLAKLTPEQVLEIRASIGMTTKVLSDKYNISMRNIRTIIKRETWKHI